MANLHDYRREEDRRKDERAGELTEIHRHRDRVAAGFTERRGGDFISQNAAVTAGTLLSAEVEFCIRCAPVRPDTGRIQSEITGTNLRKI